MRFFKYIFIIILIASSAYGEKYAGEFLYLGVGARPLAMGGAYIAAEGDAFSSYYNPAGLANLNNFQAAFMHSETFGSLLNHDYFSLARKYGDYVASVSLYRLGGGGIIITEYVDSLDIFRKIREASHADYVFGLSFARNQAAHFSWGLSTKIIYRDIIDYSAWGLGLDAGLRYQVHDNIALGMVVQDLTGTILSYSQDSKETINPTLRLGTELSKPFGKFKGTVLADTDIRFEGRELSAQFSQGFISADTHFGFEVSYKDIIAARLGSDIGNLTTGVGIKFSRYAIDLALFDHADLDNSYRGSLIVDW